MVSPFLKWVGGKSQILNDILEKIPLDINSYHEIFVGGGSVLFGILSMIKNNDINLTGNIYAYDINNALINTYKCVQCNPEELYSNILIHIENYNKCNEDNGNRKPSNIEEAMTSKESYYYWIRNKFNSIPLNKDELNYQKAGMFIFLNKTCFRGLYRESKNGFNVPFGNYKNPEVANLEHLKKVSELIERVNFICLGFDKSMLNVKKGDFVYLDPPYAPENDKSFTRYSLEDFSLDSHIKLFKMIKDLPCLFLMSNANVPLVNDAFRTQESSDAFNIKLISCKRSINSKNPGAKTLEVLISNYI